MKNVFTTLINALKTWVEEKTKTVTDEEAVDMLVQEDLLMAVADSDGSILSTEGSIILW